MLGWWAGGRSCFGRGVSRSPSSRTPTAHLSGEGPTGKRAAVLFIPQSAVETHRSANNTVAATQIRLQLRPPPSAAAALNCIALGCARRGWDSGPHPGGEPKPETKACSSPFPLGGSPRAPASSLTARPQGRAGQGRAGQGLLWRWLKFAMMLRGGASAVAGPGERRLSRNCCKIGSASASQPADE